MKQVLVLYYTLYFLYESYPTTQHMDDKMIKRRKEVKKYVDQ